MLDGRDHGASKMNDHTKSWSSSKKSDVVYMTGVAEKSSIMWAFQKTKGLTPISTASN